MVPLRLTGLPKARLADRITRAMEVYVPPRNTRRSWSVTVSATSSLTSAGWSTFLELEAVDKIILKIQNDPEPEDVKQLELNLWNKIKKVAEAGRRTGLGITGLGDALAMMGIQYGSDDSVLETGKIYRSLALGSYRGSVELAEERGAFPVFSHELESDNEFINQIIAEDKNLKKKF